MGTAFAVPANNIVSIVGPGGYTAGSGTLALAAGQGALYPALTGDQFYRITVVRAAYAYSPSATTSNLTIFRASSLVADTFGTVLAIEGTTDRNYAAGDAVDIRVTAGTISDIQTQILNMQMSSQSTMGFDYNIPTSATWYDTGFSIFLPAAGSYIVGYNVRGVIGPAVGGTGSMWITVKLVQTDTSADVIGSVRLVVFTDDAITRLFAPGGQSTQLSTAYTVIATVTSACNVKLYAKRDGSLTLWALSRISSNADGQTTMSYVRIL